MVQLKCNGDPIMIREIEDFHDYMPRPVYDAVRQFVKDKEIEYEDDLSSLNDAHEALHSE